MRKLTFAAVAAGFLCASAAIAAPLPSSNVGIGQASQGDMVQVKMKKKMKKKKMMKQDSMSGQGSNMGSGGMQGGSMGQGGMQGGGMGRRRDGDEGRHEQPRTGRRSLTFRSQ